MTLKATDEQYKPAIETILDFFNQTAIKKKIQFFIDERSNGFEKWVQFELLNYMVTEDQKIKSAEIEKPFSLNSNKMDKEKAFIDLVYQKRNQSKEFLHAVELKVRIKTTGAIKGAINDIYRLRHIPKPIFKFRSITAVAIFNSDNGEDGKYLSFIDDLDKAKRVKVHKISLKNKYKLLVISWGVPPKLAARSSFDEFVSDIKIAAKEHGIRLKG